MSVDPLDDTRREEIDAAARHPSLLAALGLVALIALEAAREEWFVPVMAGLPLMVWVLHYRVLAGRIPTLHRAAVSQVLLAADLAAAIHVTGGATSFVIFLAPLLGMILLVVFPERRWISVIVPCAAIGIGATGPTGAVDPGLAPTMLVVGGLMAVATPVLAMAAVELELRARERSVIDPLTGALNRRAFDLRAIELEAEASMTGAPVSVIGFDLDHFKAINDTFGHACGDAVLQTVAYEVRKTLRSYERLYRLGGEEFAVVLAGAGRRDAELLAERLRAAIDGELVPGITVSASFGIASHDGDDLDVGELAERADRALYHSKTAGRNRWTHEVELVELGRTTPV